MLQASHRAVLVNNIYEPVLKAGLDKALVSTFSQLQEVSIKIKVQLSRQPASKQHVFVSFQTFPFLYSFCFFLWV